MAWVESHQELRSHPKTKRLARMLGIHRMQAIGHLHALWWWALDHAEDGDVSSYEPDDLADAAAWDGDPDELVKALIECGPGDRPGFLEHDGLAGNPEEERRAALVLHDWWDHAGKWIAKRARERQRKQEERLSAAPSEGRPRDVQGTSEGQSVEGSEPVQQPSQDPDLTGPDRTTPDPPDQTGEASRGKPRSDRAHRLPDGWAPAHEDKLQAEADQAGVDLRRELEQFTDHFRSSGGQNARKVDWQAAWRKWVRKTIDDKPTRNGSRSPPPASHQVSEFTESGMVQP